MSHDLGDTETPYFTGPGVGPQEVPQRIGEYEIIEELARGGMGVVYRARQPQLDRLVALKVILGDEQPRPEAIERFFREAKAAAKLHHPGIVPIHDMGLDGRRHYFTMELVQGRSLAHEMRDEQFSVEQGLRWAVQICRAIDYAHLNGVVHRDLKPANVLIDAEGRPRITDFGLAQDADQHKLTSTGEMLGTPHYMAPEQMGYEGGRTGPETDVYALGVILYEIASGGQLPFSGDGLMALLHNIGKGHSRPLAEAAPHLDLDLRLLIEKAFAYKKADRYASSGALADDLERYLLGEPITARPLGRLEKLARTYRENRLVMNLMLVILVGTIAFGAYVSVLSRKYQQQRNAAQRERDLARTSLAREKAARQALDRSLERLKAVALANRATVIYDTRGKRSEVEALLDQAEALASDLGAVLRLRGRMALDDGKNAPARRLLERAVEVDPGDYVARYHLFRLLHQTGKGNTPEANAHALHIARMQTATPIGRWGKALALQQKAQLAPIKERKKLYLEVVRLCTRALAAEPELVLALMLRAAALAELDRHDEALADCDMVVKLTGQYNAYLNRGNIQLQLERYEAAAADFARARELAPTYPGVHRALGQLALQRGRFEEAREHLEQARKLGPRNPETHYDLGRACFALKRYQDAVEALTRAIAYGRVEHNVLLWRARAQARLGKQAEALADFEQAIKVRPDWSQPYYYRALLHKAQGRYQQAIADLTRSIRAQPNNPLAYTQRAWIHGEAGRRQASIADYSTAISQQPNSAALYFSRGTEYLAIGRAQEAMADFDRAHGLAPTDHRTLLNRANLLVALGRQAEALRDYDRAIALAPRVAQYYVNRSVLYKKLGRRKDAVADLDRAVRLEPGNLRAYLARGVLHYQAGRWACAEADLRRALPMMKGKSGEAQLRQMIQKARSQR